MKATLCLVHVYVLVRSYCISRLKAYHILTGLQLCIFMVSLLLVTFLRLTKPIRRARLQNISPVNTLLAFRQANRNHKISIGYAPKTEATSAIINNIQDRLVTSFQKTDLVSFEGFPTEIHLMKSYCVNDSAIHMAIVFRDVTNSSSTYIDSKISTCKDDFSNGTPIFAGVINEDLPRHLEVVIRPSVPRVNSDHWHTGFMYPHHQSSCGRNSLKGYTTTGIIILLQFVLEAIIKHSSATVIQYELSTKGIDCRHEWVDPLQKALRFVMPIVMSTSYLPRAILLACEMLHEKNENMRKMLISIGVHALVYTTSWVLCIVMEVLLLGSMLTAVFFMPGEYTALPNSNPGVIFVFVVSYGLAIMSVIAWMTTFLVRDVPLAFAIILLLLTQTLLFTYASDYKEKLSTNEKLLLSFFINYVLDLGCSLIVKHEETGQGVNWTNILNPPTTTEKFSVAFCLLIFAINISVNIAFRVAHVGNLYRAPTALIKAFKKMLRNDAKTRKYRQKINNLNSRNIFVEEDLNSEIFLQFDGETKQLYQLKSLHFKVYKKKTTVLLGYHEKEWSKLIEILSGQLDTTSSVVTVCDAPLKKYLKANPSFLGICTQQISVFDALSVQENIQLFGQLKGLSWQMANQKAQKVLKQFGISKIRHVKAGKLSVYWSRILGMAIAVLGDPQMLLIEDLLQDLEEVHADIVLDVLTNLLASRTAVVITKVAETAFHLGDKIEVDIDGGTVCFGSKDFVHYCFGSGYRLHTSLEAGSNVEGLIDYMQFFVPTLVVLKKSDSELICLLPKNSRHKFEFLIGNLLTKKMAFKIQSMQINDITMDELLFKLRDYRTAQSHLQEVEKYRSATEVLSLKTLSESASWPTISYSALYRTNSGRFSLIKKYSSDDTFRFSHNVPHTNSKENNTGYRPSIVSVFRALKLMGERQSNLSLLQSSNVDQFATTS